MDYDPYQEDGKPYTVCSLYLDTGDLMCYAQKYNGDLVRSKYRIRFYNGDMARLFFEVKSKYNAFVKKSRTSVVPRSASMLEVPELLESEYSKINPDFVYGYKVYHLNPTVWVRYRRTALVGRNNPALRVNFDEEVSGTSAQRFRPLNLSVRPIQFSNWTKRIILEIKFTRQFPLWLENAMRDLGFIQEAISKYGMVLARNYAYRKDVQWTH